MRWLSPFVAIVLLFVLATAAAAQGNSVTLNLPAMNGSGESGTVMLTPSGSNLTELIIQLSGQPQLQTQYQNIGGQQVINPSTYGGAVPQLASVYTGTCTNYSPTNPPNLNATTPNGPNVTGNGWLVIKMSVSDLLAGNYVVAVHKDATDKSPLVACVPLTASAEQPASSSAASSSTAPAASSTSSTSSGSSSTTSAATSAPAALPQTGTPGAALAVFAAGGLALVGMGFGLRRRASVPPGSASDEKEMQR